MKKRNLNFIKIAHQLLILTSLVVGFVCVFTYESFFVKHFYVSQWILYFSFIMSSFFDKVYSSKKIKRVTEINSKLYLISAVVIGLLYLILSMIEVFTYPNFVFSTLHIHSDLLIYPMSILIIEYLFRLNIQDTNKKIKKGFYKLMNLNTLVIPIMVLMVMNNLIGLSARMRKDIYFMATNINATKDKVYEYKLGKTFYEYTKFINSNTPKDSKILIPPFPAYPWPQTGNVVYFRYFLSPRSLTSGNEYSAGVNINDYDYVLVAWGETPTTSVNYTHGWPKFDVKAEYILYIDENGNTKKVEGNYIYSKLIGKEQWGIIKIKK